jgi:hypothetical protein
LIGRYELARAALGAAQSKLDSLATVPPAALVSGSEPFELSGRAVGTVQWTVAWVDDPGDGTGGTDTNGVNDLQRAVVAVSWVAGGESDAIQVERYFPAP